MNNLLSFLLGLASWGLGISAVIRPDSRWTRAVSLLSCAVSLLLQLAEVHRLTDLGDWSALMDTMDAVLAAAILLVAVTAALNLIALVRRNT